MKNRIRIGLVFTGLLALLSFCMSVYLMSGLLIKPPADTPSDRVVRHFSLYLPQNRNSYFTDIMEGAQKEAKESGAVLSVHILDPEGTALHLASYIGVDGVLVCPDLDDEIVFEKLMRLSSLSIPVVLVNHNIQADQPWAFVGTNNFDFGKKAGALIKDGEAEDTHLAVIYSDKSPAIYAERELVEMGIYNALGRTLSSPILGQKTDMNPRDAEKVVYNIVRNRPEIDTLIFTDLNDTLAGTQALIDLNQVGRVQVIGFGIDPAIMDFIEKGIISGTLVVNPFQMGVQAVRSLAELESSGYTSTTVDTGIDVIHRNNLFSWKFSRGEDRR